MTALRDVYKCTICGNVSEVLAAGAGSFVCCGKPMVKLVAKTEDTGKEKHVPVITDEPSGGIKVTVGGVPHPMEEKHYINFIEVLLPEKVVRVELKPGMKPEAVFCSKRSDVIEVREYCNLHDLWKAN
jgi:superoxide reductase